MSRWVNDRGVMKNGVRPASGCVTLAVMRQPHAETDVLDLAVTMARQAGSTFYYVTYDFVDGPMGRRLMEQRRYLVDRSSGVPHLHVKVREADRRLFGLLADDHSAVLDRTHGKRQTDGSLPPGWREGRFSGVGSADVPRVTKPMCERSSETSGLCSGKRPRL